jgi:hypothetical protein
MRAMDCVHEAHEDMHFTAEDDASLLTKVKEHRDQHHPELSDEEIEQIVAANAYDE